jgi:hypothetical protein
VIKAPEAPGCRLGDSMARAKKAILSLDEIFFLLFWRSAVKETDSVR